MKRYGKSSLTLWIICIAVNEGIDMYKQKIELGTWAANNPYSIARYDRDGRFIYINSQYEDTLDTPLAAVKGRSVDEFFPESYQDLIGAIRQAVLTGKEIRYMRQQLTKKDGTMLYHTMSFFPEFNEDGEVESVLSLGREISAVNRMQEELAFREEELRLLAESAPGMMGAYYLKPDGSVCMPYVSYKIFEIFGLYPEDVRKDASALMALHHPEDDAFIKESIAESARKMSTWQEEFRIIHPSKGVRWLKSNTNPMPHPEGGVIWYGSVCDITDCKQKEKVLAETTVRLTSLFAAIPDPIWLKDSNGYYLTCNDAFARFVGLPADEVVGKSENLICNSVETCKKSDEKAVKRGGLIVTEEQVVGGDGKEFLFEVRKLPIYDDSGNVQAIMGIGQDITERKQVEERLRKSEENFRTLVESADDYILRYDQKGAVVYMNPQLRKLLGVRLEDVVGKRPTHVSTDTYNDLEKALDSVLINGETVNLELILPQENGEECCHLVKLVAERNGQGKIVGVLGIGRDLTERKQMEKALARREREFRTLAEHSPDTIARFDLECNRTYVNPTFLRIFGKSKEEVLGKQPAQSTPIPEQLSLLFENTLRKVLRTGESVQMETPFVDAGGKQGFGNLKIVPEFGEDGAVVSALCIGRDITKRKEMEEALARRERAFRTLAENSPDIIARFDLELRRVYVSPAFTELSGVPTEEIVGFTPTQKSVLVGSVALEYEDFLRGIISSRERGNFDMTWTDTAGRKSFWEQQAVPEYDNDGKISGVLTVSRNITERKIAEEHIAYMAHHDGLTGLPNRIFAKIRMEEVISRGERNGGKAALLFIDLDGFKVVNDTLGHSTGDVLLKMIAQRLKGCIRANDFIGRQGGDEFLLILADPAEAVDILGAVKRLRSELESPFNINGRSLNVSMSIGVAVFPEDGNTYEVLLRKADTAMYRAKEFGRDIHCFYADEMNRHMADHLRIQNDLKRALVAGELELYYQPQITTLDQKITGAEALLRWEHPNDGMVLPSAFIPVAESSGLIVPIGDWVIEQVCHQAALWHTQGMQLNVAVNISAVQLRRGDLVKTVKSALQSSGLAPQFLELELTESVIMQDMDKTLDTVQQLKTLGVRLAIDDFGTGYSSLAYLKRFATDKLKIDGSFVRDIVHDADDAAIVQAILQMANTLGITTVAEGVEDQATVEILQGLSCDIIQGYVFSPALNKAQFQEFYTQYDDHAWQSDKCRRNVLSDGDSLSA